MSRRSLPARGGGRRSHGGRFRSPGFRRYISARLHRRLFVMMGVAIFTSFGLAFAVIRLTSNGLGWGGQVGAIEEFARERFVEVWGDPERRERLVEQTSRAFGVSLRVSDAQGRPLHQAGGHCRAPIAVLTIPSASGGVAGSVAACRGGARGSQGWGFAFAFGLAAFGLWLAAGVIAHRLGRPLWQLVQVTKSIGGGDLSARARLSRHNAGEVGVLAQSINDMAERIERQLKDQRELLAGVSHEIRTPLARLRVLTEMLRDRGGDARLLDDAEREVIEIDDLTGQLLASSRLNFDSLEARALDGIALAQTALERVGVSAAVLVADATAVDIVGDATLITRALVNLLTNARVHGGAVQRVRLFRRKGEYVFCVEDSGDGFDAGQIGRAFEPFVRHATPASAGSDHLSQTSLGLGLSLVARIARAHGGSVGAENLEGVARPFGFRSPLRTGAVEL